MTSCVPAPWPTRPESPSESRSGHCGVVGFLTVPQLSREIIMEALDENRRRLIKTIAIGEAMSYRRLADADEYVAQAYCAWLSECDRRPDLIDAPEWMVRCVVRRRLTDWHRSQRGRNGISKPHADTATLYDEDDSWIDLTVDVEGEALRRCTPPLQDLVERIISVYPGDRDRARDICLSLAEGRTMKSISEDHDLGESRISQIVRGLRGAVLDTGVNVGV